MAEEIDEGVAYLAALKHGSGEQAATATAPARDGTGEQGTSTTGVEANGGGPFKGAEKRRSPRYKCEGSVELREDGCDVRTWASFTDVSLHGCYVEAQATYPVGTVLHMKMEVNGVRVESQGNVRVSYPYLGMGIAFVDMTEENRARLKEMLASVSHSRVIVGPGVVSTFPTSAPLEGVPNVSDPLAAIQAVIHFFEARHMLTREEFLTVVRRSQAK